jgi:hypothetical protein
MTFQIGQIVKDAEPSSGYEAWRYKVYAVDEEAEDGLTVHVGGEWWFHEDDLIAANPDERMFEVYLPGYTFLIAATTPGEAKAIVMCSEWGEYFSRDDIFDCVRYRPETIAE